MKKKATRAKRRGARKGRAPLAESRSIEAAAAKVKAGDPPSAFSCCNPWRSYQQREA